MDVYQHLDRLRKNLTPSTARAVLLLDIDDTLIDCRLRKHRVFMDFIEQPLIQKQFPRECARLAQLEWQAIQYRVHDNLAALAIAQAEFAAALFSFWQRHYFTYPYLIQDIAFDGAIEFVKYHYERDLCLVYLSGRDQKGMGPGTLDSLARLGFPTQGHHIHFILKPEVAMNDFEFKLAALGEVATIGPVLAAFENELGNLNAMAQRFPDAAVYWRKTLYAPDPPPPHPRVQILSDFPRAPI